MRIQYQKLFHFFVLEFSFAYFNCLYVIANTLFSFFYSAADVAAATTKWCNNDGNDVMKI